MAGVAVIWLVIIGTSIWVAVDSSNIGARKGLVKGSGNMGPAGWFFCCLLIWIIGFPVYLAKRSEIKAAAAASNVSVPTPVNAVRWLRTRWRRRPAGIPRCPKPATRRGRHSIGSHQQSRRACQVRCTAPVRGSDPGGVQRREGEAAQSTAAAANPSSVRV